jgi:hypothetical protein
LPTISITWTTISSPSMIFSPGRRVIMSIEDSSLESFEIVTYRAAARRP